MNNANPINLKKKLYEIIFGVDTPAGRLFDIVLLWAILLSILCILLESVSSIRIEYGRILKSLEWGFTALFTVEYFLRLYCAERTRNYAKSFLGIIDLLAILPTYLGLFIAGTSSFLLIRGLRLLRIFRVFKLTRFINEFDTLVRTINAVRIRILVFLGTVLTLVLIIGALMYMIEGERNGFTSIPRSMYWAVVTMTTVGYGDITPQTILGQILSSIVMLLGYGIIVVPAGLFSAELALSKFKEENSVTCPSCQKNDHKSDSAFCRFCSSKLI